MSARTLGEGASAASAPFRATANGPNNRTATDWRDASQTPFKSNANPYAGTRVIKKVLQELL
jgi:hypothetical protein